VPNIKSAMKRVKVSKKQNLRNRAIKSSVKTALKKYDAALENNVDEAKAALPTVTAAIDKAAAKGVIHKNTANRRKAAVARKLQQAQASGN
jgi:small subunit ribosomal protein S20